jgi:hypothetical protein
MVLAPGAKRCGSLTALGKRCKNPALIGTEVCRKHGGSLPSVKAKSEIVKRSREFGIAPIDADDPESRGDIALAVEIRRTVAWIRYCEARIEAAGGAVPSDAAAEAALADILGGLQLISHTTVSGVERGDETSLETSVYGHGINVWEEKLRWNRAHLATLTKQWIAAGFEARRLELQERTINAFEKAQHGILSDLGLDFRNPEVRAVVKKRIAEAAGEAE